MRVSIALPLVASLAGCAGGSGSGGSGPVVPLASGQLVFDSDRAGGTHEIYVMNADGTGVTRLTNDASYQNWWPRVSPDRRKVLFYRAPFNKPESYPDASLWVMNADGSGVTQLRAKGEDGWSMQGHGEWSPDGTRIAMFGSAGAALEIFVTDASGKNPVQYTSRGGVNTDVSCSPDGSKIAWLVDVDPTANVIPTTTTALGRWAIRIADIDAGGSISNASYLIDDGNINSKPAWSLDGRTIFFHRMVPPDYRFRVFSIQLNGAGLTELTPGATGNSEHPSN